MSSQDSQHGSADSPAHAPADAPVDPVRVSAQHGGEIEDAQIESAQTRNGDSKSPNGHQAEHPTGHGAEPDRHSLGEEVIPKDLKEPGNRTIVVLGIVVAVLIVAMFLIGWFPAHFRAAEAAADASERASALPIVNTTQPSIPSAEQEIVLPCDVRANQQTMLYSRATGFLKKWYVDINDRVKAGQLLATIDIPDVDAQLNAAKASLEQARASVETAKSNLDLAQKTLDRYQEANKNQAGSVTQEDLDTRISTRDQAVASLKQSQANVGVAQSNVNLEQTLVSFESVYAPFNGVVTYRGYDVGALINTTDQSAGKELFDIQQTDPLRVFVSVPQNYATQLSMGQPAELFVRNYIQPFHGQVVRSTASVDTTTRTMSFQVDFPNPDNKLFPGMYGQVHLPISQKESTLTIPASALVFNSGGAQVITIKDNKAHFQKITIGRDLGTALEITSGLTADDVIDVNPDEQIVENTQVQIAGGKERAKPERVAEKD
jgi:RND family efflux transporter MFP subunit